MPEGNPPEVSVFIHHTRKCSWCAIPSVCTQIYYLLNAFQSAKQVCCSRHSMAALQPALSWDFLHHVTEKHPDYCVDNLDSSQDPHVVC